MVSRSSVPSFARGRPKIVRNRQLGCQHAGEVQLAERVRVVERHARWDGGGRDRKRRRPVQRRAWQAELSRQRLDAVNAPIHRGFAEAAVAVQRDRPVDGSERPEPLVGVLDEQLMVKQPPPQRHCLARQGGLDLVADAVHLHPGVNADPATLGLARKGTEPFPGAHGPDARFWQVGQPILCP